MLGDVALLASVVAIASILVASTTQTASGLPPLTRANKITFSRDVALPGVTLTAGTYVFEAGPGGTNPNIVRVLSHNRRRLFYLGFTVPRTRPEDAEAGVLTFGEAAEDGAAPILLWYPIGSNSGHEFVYRQSSPTPRTL